MRRQILVVVTFVVVVLMAGTATFLAVLHAGGSPGVQWNQIGPAPLQIDAAQNFQGNGPDSGQAVDVAIDPRGSTDQIIFIATQEGGIWQSLDGGATWRTTTDFLNTLSMGSVALDPGNPSIVYAGTGDPANTGFFKGIGIYQSTDGGNTWTLVPANGVNFSGQAVRRIAMPNPNTLLAATGGGLARSINQGSNFTVTLGGSIDDIHVDTAATTTSASPQTVYAAVDSTGIFRSADSGATWGTNLWTVSNGSPLSVVNFTPGFISFAQSTQPNNQTIYASVQNTNALAVNPKWGLFVSIDSGANWTQAAAAGNPSNNCGQCGYDQTIGVDPRDATAVYLGFVNMWKSTDSGANFSIMTGVHNDHHALVFSPHVPGSGSTPFYDGSDGGFASSNGSTFTALNGPNPGPGKAIATNLLRNIDIGRGSSTNNKYSYGGMQDTGEGVFKAADSPTTWHLNQDGDGAGTAVDPFAPTHAVAMDDACLQYTVTAGLDNWPGATFPAGFFGGPGFAFGNTLAFDQVSSAGPTDNTVYASIIQSSKAPLPGQGCFGQGTATFELFRSTNGGVNYAQFATPASYPAQINAIATVKIDPATIWLALNDGTLRVSTNATGGSPSFAAPPTQPAAGGATATALAIDPSDTKTVVVTYGAVSKQVFITTNGGTTWTDISAGLPPLPVHAVVIDPSTNPHTIIIGNDAGVLQTGDGGTTWQVLGIGMPNVDVVSLQLDASVTPEVLRAGTFGRSAFDLGAPTGPLIAVNSTFNFGTLCPGETPTELLQIFNVGASDLIISSISQVSPNPDFVLTGPSFPVTIKVGEELDFTISFTPKLANEGTTETVTYQINSNSVVNPSDQVTYTATVGAPNGSTTIADSGNFGNVCLGSFADLNLTIANKGTCDLLVSNITSSDADFLPPSTLVYPLAVHAGTSVAVPVRFDPLSTGTKNGIITVVSSNNPSGNPPMSVNVNGNSPTPIINVTGTGIFGSKVCTDTSPAPEQTLQINNVGACNLNVTSAIINCLDFTLVNPNEFPATISPDFGLGVGVNFTPTSTGLKSCKLTIVSNDPTSPTMIPLTGTQGTGLMTVTGGGDFGAAVCGGKAPPQTLKVNNVGPCNLAVTSAVINCPVTANNPGGLPQFVLVNPLEFPATISADSGLDVGINFTPTQAGLQTCTIKFTSAAPNPQMVTFPLTATTPFGSSEIKVTVPPGLTFPPTVIQQDGVCSSEAGVPITNVGACPVNITDVDILTQSSKNPPGFDYMLTGVPQLNSPTLGGPITQTIVPGGQLGSGDLNLVFAPFKITRESTGTVKVIFEDDPILHTFKTDTVPVCGEAVQRGMRVIVTLAGVPVPLVDKIALQRAIGNGNFSTLQSFKNALLRTVTGTPPCASFRYHAEFGGNTNSTQLKIGTYRVKVTLKIGKKTHTAIVQVNLDHCTFNQNVVVAF